MMRARFTRFGVRTPATAAALRVASSRPRRHMLASAVAVALVAVSVLTAAPAPADAQTRNLTVHTVGAPQSVDVACLDESCTAIQATLTGTATSNLAGQGTFQLRVIRTSLDDGCHNGEEFTTFTFATGTISTHTRELHACGTPTGLALDQPFDITGGTGAFASATGGGREFTASGGLAPIMWIGTITL
jgi:hypothetical protein